MKKIIIGGVALIVVIGVGEVGYNLVKALSKEAFDITVVDIDENKCQRITNSMDVHGIVGDGCTVSIPGPDATVGPVCNGISIKGTVIAVVQMNGGSAVTS